MIWSKAIKREELFFIPYITGLMLIITTIGLISLFMGIIPDPLDSTKNIPIWNPHNFPVWGIFLTLLVLTEFFFWLDKSKPDADDDRLMFTAWHKIGAFFDGVFVLGVGGCLWWIGEQIMVPSFWEWLSATALAIVSVFIAAVLLYGYVWLNSQRYAKRAEAEQK